MSYINTDCIYKIIPKINLEKAIKVDETKMIPVLYNKVNGDRNTDVDDDQNWHFEYDKKYESYKITNLKTNRVLGYSDEGNSEHILMDAVDIPSPYYRWIFELTNDGYVIIKNAGDIKATASKTDKVLDVYGSKGENGNKVILHDRTGRDNQKFKLVRYKFIKGHSYKEATKLENPYVQEENTYKNLEDLKHKLFSSDQFIKKWANIAEMLGFKYCSGTRGVNIGEDFKVTKLHNGNYILKANYRKGDPFDYGGNLSHRLEIQISDVRLTFDPHSIKPGKPSITKLNPTVISTTNAINHADTEGTVTTEIEYTTGHTVSNSTSNSISNSISIENAFKLKIQGLKFEESLTYTFEHEKTWGQQVDKSTETKLKSTYLTTVPAKSSMPIYALLTQSKANIPYKAKAHLEYAVRFLGFLKPDNALKNKSMQNQKIEYSFGTRKIPATKFLQSEYLNRNVHGLNGWDYTWSILNYEPDYFNKHMSEAITPDEVQISGIFTDIASTNVTIVAGRKPDEDDYKILDQKDLIKDEHNPDGEDELSVEIEFPKKS